MAVQPLYYVKAEDIIEFEGIRRQLLALIKKEKPMDAALVSRFISLIPASRMSLQEIIYKGGKVQEALKNIHSQLDTIIPYLSRSISDDTYRFNGINNEPEKGYSIEHLIVTCTTDYIDADCDNKKEAVIEFDKIVNKYIEKHVEETDRELLTQYKRYVLVGLLTHFISGFKLVDPAKDITNGRIFDAVRGVLKSKK